MKFLSLEKDFIREAKEEDVNLLSVGAVTKKDVSLDQSPELREFYERNYRPGYILTNSKLFNWMFANNGGHVATLSSDRQIFAHQGHVPVVFTDGQNDYRGFFSASTMTDVNQRRKGLMTYLRGDVQGRYEMAASIGGSPEGVKLYSNMGYRLYGNLIRMVGIVDQKLAKEVSKKFPVDPKLVVVSTKENESIKPIMRFADIASELDSLLHAVFSPGKYFMVKRDVEYLDWRYTDHPFFDYKRCGLWDGRRLEALIIFRYEEIPGKGKVIRIVEMIGHPHHLTELVQDAVLTTDRLKEVAWVDWFCTKKDISESLRPLGFFSDDEWRPTEFPIYCSPVDYFKKFYPYMFWAKDEETFSKAPVNLDQWYVTKGDGDADRPNDNWVTPSPENACP